MKGFIAGQLYEILLMLYCGMAVMLVFQVRNWVMRLFQNRRQKAAVYLLFWLIAAFLFCRFLYCSSYGRLRLAGLLSMAAGVFLWKKYIYGILDISTEARVKRETRDAEKKAKT